MKEIIDNGRFPTEGGRRVSHMRIGVDLRCLASGRRSGVEEYAVGLLSTLFRLDRENEYVLFFNEWRKVPVDFSWAERFPNVSIRRFRIPNKLLNLSLWYFGRPRLDRLIGGVDAFFFPNVNFMAVSPGVRIFATAHDLSFEVCPETFSWKRRAWHFILNPRRFFHLADRIFSVSRSTRDDLVSRYGIPPGRITVIPSGLDPMFRIYDRNDPHLLAVKEKYGLPFYFVLSFGAFEPRKNQVAIVHAFETLKRSRNPKFAKLFLVLAGVSGWKDREIRHAVEHSPFRGNIVLSGFIAPEDKPAFYNLASVFAYPSFYEGFGFPALEALGCGVPTVASNNTSLPEVVGDAGILVDPHRPDELFRALEAVLTDRDLAERLRKRGPERARRFSWEMAAKLVLSEFQGRQSE